MRRDLQSRILSKKEIGAVLAYLKDHRRYAGTRRNLIVFRLACCCGLRCCEIAGLELRDFFVKSDRPFIRIRKDATKRSRRPGAAEATSHGRKVPLSHDDQTLKDLTAWLEKRKAEAGGNLNAPFVCAQRSGAAGGRLTPKAVGKRWRSAIKVLGEERVAELNPHSGRHTCISQLIWANFPITYVRDFAGHKSIATTSLYLHLCNEEELPKNVFA